MSDRRFIPLYSVGTTKKDDFRRGTYHLCGPEARVPRCRLDEGSLPCLVVRSRYGDEKKMIPGAVRTIYAGRRPAYPGAGLTKVLYLVLSSVRDTAMKKDDSRRGTYHLCGPEARVPGCRLDEGSLLCLVVRSRYGDEKR